MPWTTKGYEESGNEIVLFSYPRGEQMFEKVLFPTDLSEFAQRMLDCIREIPGVREVVLLNIIDATQYSLRGWTHEQERENAKLLMEEKKNYLEGQGLDVVTYVDAITSGSLSQRILEVAEQEKVSLTVMGTHQKTTMESFLHGSVSYDLLHHMNTHVLIVRQNVPACEGQSPPLEICPHLFSRVLLPVDFTELSRETLTFVRKMRGPGELVLVHVVTQGETKEEIDRGIVQAGGELEKIQKDLEQAGFRVSTHVRVADPVGQIVSLADEEDVSLILMSAHRKNWVEEFLQDSTPFSVARRAKRPLMILRLE
jgi:nucleotide-binding universal stress UspA family protein